MPTCSYLTFYDAREISHWSGCGIRIWQTLKMAGLETENIFSEPVLTPWERILRFTHRKMGRNFDVFRREAMLRRIAADLDRQLQGRTPDLLVSPGTMQTAFLQHPAPMVYWVDATFKIIRDYYHTMADLPSYAVRENERIERRALARASWVVASSEWARRSVIDDYGVPADRVVFLPMGANFDTPPNRERVLASIERRDPTKPRALFMGVDWIRKGGDFAVEAVGLVREMGIPLELDLVGCTPPGGEVPPYIHLHPFIPKTTAEGQALLEELHLRSDIFLLPSRADCTPVVFSEAASYGLPLVSFHTGGIPSVIDHERTGMLPPLEEGARGLAEAMVRILTTPGLARRMSIASLEKYETELNWPSVAQGFRRKVLEPMFGDRLDQTGAQSR